MWFCARFYPSDDREVGDDSLVRMLKKIKHKTKTKKPKQTNEQTNGDDSEAFDCTKKRRKKEQQIKIQIKYKYKTKPNKITWFWIFLIFTIGQVRHLPYTWLTCWLTWLIAERLSEQNTQMTCAEVRSEKNNLDLHWPREPSQSHRLSKASSKVEFSGFCAVQKS